MLSIKLNDYSHKIIDVISFKQNLINKIKDQIFLYDDLKDINYLALKAIYPVNKTVRNNPDSIEKHARIVYDHFNPNSKRITILGSKVNKQLTATDYFQHSFLQLDKAPKKQLENLRKKVEYHLKQMTDLIKYYESLDEVQTFIKNGKITDNTIIHFYKRSLKKRGEIIDHYLYSSYDRALEKCIPDHPVFNIIKIFDYEKDYPYLSMWWDLIEKHDYRKIDCFSHRYPSMSINEIEEFRSLHYKNKGLFYQIIFKSTSVENIFTNIFKNLDSLPVHHFRIKIFKELQFLQQNKKWISFYTLGLIQAEGLFTEMLKCAQVKPGRNTFVQKVNHIRSKYYLNQFELDYYEFILPKERNKLVHVGLDENLDIKDYELKSYDILTDLEHITKVFSEMENPLVYITKILKTHDKYSFSSTEAFIEFFKNADEIKKTHPETHKEVIKFVEEKLIKNHELLELITASGIEIQNSIVKIKDIIKRDFENIVSLEHIYKFNKEKYESLNNSIDVKKRIITHLIQYTETYEKFFVKEYFKSNKNSVISNQHKYWKENNKNFSKLFDFFQFFEKNNQDENLSNNSEPI